MRRTPKSARRLAISGGIAFETSERGRAAAASPEGASFKLYDNERTARRDPAREQIVYLADFSSNLRGVDQGTAVELEGIEIGTVRNVQLSYDDKRHMLTTLVTLAVDPHFRPAGSSPQSAPARNGFGRSLRAPRSEAAGSDTGY